MEYLSQNHLNKYKNSIVVISGETNMLLKVRDNPLVHSFINKGKDMDLIVDNINKLCDLKQENLKIKNNQKKKEIALKNRILKELLIIGYTPQYVGTSYLVDTIYYMYYKRNNKNIKLEKDIYPIISNKYNKTVNTVKCDIIRATSKVTDSSAMLQHKNYFGYFFDAKIKPQLVIKTILNKIIYKV